MYTSRFTEQELKRLVEELFKPLEILGDNIFANSTKDSDVTRVRKYFQSMNSFKEKTMNLIESSDVDLDVENLMDTIESNMKFTRVFNYK